MSGRPEILFPLFADLETLSGVGAKTAQNFEKMDITKPRDLLFALPNSGVTWQRIKSIQGVVPPANIIIEITVGNHLPPRSRGRPYRVEVSDGDTVFQLVFFHPRIDYLQKILPTGQKRLIAGKLEHFDSIAQIVHPEQVLRLEDDGDLPAFEPVYPLTAGVSKKLMIKAVQGAISLTVPLEEWIDKALINKENWPNWRDAISAAHTPKSDTDLLPTTAGRARLAYDELFAHQITLALARRKERSVKGRASVATGVHQSKVLSALPYTPTGAQARAVAEISDDMARPVRMMRMLQGDVGAGKTYVALMALLVAVESGGQGVMMAPTEILARQHYAGLQPLCEAAGVVLEMLTGRDNGREREAKLQALKAGNIHILVGTHAVFQKDVFYHDLRLAIIDEQHRFGVEQRAELAAKGPMADVLVMTATPIPRSLSLAQFGDMDISILDEKPPGRKPIKTAMVSTGRISEVVDHLRGALAAGRQAYWVCPLVEESEVVDKTAAQERFKHLRASLGDDVVGLVHGRMEAAEKDAVMARFKAGDLKVLVATTVIEVGVDVPNATIMVIERAESFGLAQLHQLRGRVGRGAAQSTCLLMYQAPLSKTATRRLEIMRETEDGFVIAEEDLAMRGAGDLIGTAQSGLPKFRVADLESQAGLMEIAQTDARKLLHDDPKLESERGKAVRVLLWLMEQEKSIRLISVG